MQKIEIGAPKIGNIGDVGKLVKRIEMGDMKVEELVKKIQMNNPKVGQVGESVRLGQEEYPGKNFQWKTAQETTQGKADC